MTFMHKPGHCIVTGEQCFDVPRVHPANHPLADSPSQVGLPHDTALRVTCVSVSGALMTLTMTPQGLADLNADPGLWPVLWLRAKHRSRADRKAHAALGQTPFTDQQHAHADRVNLLVNADPPIGIVAVQQWKDVDG